MKVWLKVEDMVIIDTVNGKAMMVTVKKRNGRYTRAWITTIIEMNLTLKNASKGTKDIKSLGGKDCRKDKTDVL